MLHYKEIIEVVKKLFGDKADLAAEIHLLRDCSGYVPTKVDWEKDRVDNLGIPYDKSLLDKNWKNKWKKPISISHQ